MHHIFRAALLALALVLLATGPAPAQDKTPPAPAAGTPAKKTDNTPAQKTPVSIEHDDTDPIGAKLAYHIKELLGRSSLMQLTGKDEKKLVILLKTKEEFPGRPNVSSIYAITWLFSSREGALKYFLSTEAGIVDIAGVDQTADAILGKTAKLASTYGYLF